MTSTAEPRAAGGLEFFADRFGIDPTVCDAMLAEALSRGGDYADLFFEYRRQRTVRFEDGAVRSIGSGIVQGVGVRVVLGEAVGYASAEQIDVTSMRAAAQTAAEVAASGASAMARAQPVREAAVADRYPVATFSLDEPVGTTLALLRRADAAARAVAPSIQNVQVRLLEEVRHIAVATSEGRLAGDVRPVVKLVATALSERGTDRQSGGHGAAARTGLDFFASGAQTPEAIGRLAAERACRLHDAVDAPAGFLPVVLAPGNPGVFLHEAVGHGLEADFNRKRLSNFTDRLGERVASTLCTVVDDGTVPRMHGSLNVDDEGQAPRRNVLIERGVLRGYLHDWISARHFGVTPSGNGRRQDFRNPPMPRMTTTYMEPGEAGPEDVVAAVDRGIFCRSFSGGQVNISTGDYVFATEEAYLIEGGKVTAPIRTTNLIGNGPDSLNRVTMVGNDLELSDMGGMCGKGDVGSGQWVPVSLGLPTVLVDGITVGGTRP